MKRIMMTAALLLISVVTALAAGDIAAVAEPTAFDNFVSNTLQPCILSVLGLVVTGAVGYLSGLLKKKFGLEISTAMATRINQVAYNSVMAVEESAAAYLKEKGNKIVGETKHAQAVEMILQKVPSLSKEEADNLVLSAIGMVKGLGASKAVGA